MPNNNIICLRVNELYENKSLQKIKTALPSLCFFEFTQELLMQIDKTKEMLFEQGLHEISFQTYAASWFFKLTNRYHQNITTYIHISETEIFFSGKMRPFNDVHFCTPKVSINQLKYNKIPIKPIQLNQLTIPLALGLIKKIKQLNSQYSDVEDLFYRIEPLVNEIRALDEKSALDLHLNSDSQIGLLSRQSNELAEKMQSLEAEMLSLSRIVLHKVFGVSKGDWISCSQLDDSTLTQLQYEHCDIYENTLTISGTAITKSGLLGKREQSISIELLS
jgi:hypothetical protein